MRSVHRPRGARRGAIARAIRGRGVPRRAGAHRGARAAAARLQYRGRGTRARPRRRHRSRARTLARCAARRRAGRAQGQPLHARRAHHRLVADPRGLRAAVRRDGRHPPRSGRRGHRRQDELRRVRDGLVDGELRLRPVTESVGARSDAGRIERRIGRRGRGAAWRRWRSGRTPADRSASRRRSAASSA